MTLRRYTARWSTPLSRSSPNGAIRCCRGTSAHIIPQPALPLSVEIRVSGSIELKPLPTTYRHLSPIGELRYRQEGAQHLFLDQPLCFTSGTPHRQIQASSWLVGELPKKRRRTEVSVSMQWQPWCRRQAQ
jgi:hypothetical protein